MFDALVIGGGPAGLMAADVLSQAGKSVLVTEAKPSIGRKFLMAGKSGLNLTNAQPFDSFLATYAGSSGWLEPMLRAFGPDDIQDWARGLGQDVFVGSTGRVFPDAMKASPLLRAWLGRLANAGVTLRTRWRWTGWDKDALVFDTPEGLQTVAAHTTLLALGGASWPRLGSDGAWAELLQAEGVVLAPFAASNVGLQINWSRHMSSHFGAPLKAVAWHAGDTTSRGEAVITATGLEGGGLYSLSEPLRNGATLTVDLVPDLSLEALRARLATKPAALRLGHWLRNSLRLPKAKIALFNEFTHGTGVSRDAWPECAKALPLRHAGLSPIQHAISTSGGVAQEAVDAGLQLHARANVWCAGEMLDWDAPTGGYLLTACFATGRWAGASALRALAN